MDWSSTWTSCRPIVTGACRLPHFSAPWVDSACADYPGYLVLGAAPDPWLPPSSRSLRLFPWGRILLFFEMYLILSSLGKCTESRWGRMRWSKHFCTSLLCKNRVFIDIKDEACNRLNIEKSDCKACVTHNPQDTK